MDYTNYLDKLSKSTFRSKFALTQKDKDYIYQKGLEVIKSHAYDFVNSRLVTIQPNDGKQTPMRGHPVFVAQHATATCCRGCISKWYHIPQDKILSSQEVDFIVGLIMAWILKQLNN